MAEDKELQQIKKRLSELAERSYNKGIYTFTPFLGLSEQQAFYEIQSAMEYAGYRLEGGCPLCERKMIRFGSPKQLGYEADYPIMPLKIEPVQRKFAEELTHRDFLGALMNLGIERSTVGDIFVQEKGAFLFCQESIAPFLTENLSQVRHTQVRCEVTAVPESLLSPATVEEILTVSSARIDGIVSKLYNIARGKSQELFHGGRVYVGGRLMENNSYMLKEGDVVTVRGFGRFVYAGEQGMSRKGKYRVGVEVYR